MVANDDDDDNDNDEHSITTNKIRMKYTYFKRTYVHTRTHAYICAEFRLFVVVKRIVSETTKIVWLKCYYRTQNMLSNRSKTHKKEHLMVCWLFLWLGKFVFRSRVYV